jgi:hypothetical protein
MKIDDSVYGIDETGIFRIKIELRRGPEAEVQKIPSELPVHGQQYHPRYNT